MHRMPILHALARWIILAIAFADHCKANDIPAVKATTDELRAFAAYREETS